jgi:hypothetical protein
MGRVVGTKDTQREGMLREGKGGEPSPSIC